MSEKPTGDNILYNVSTEAVKPKIYAISISNREQEYLGLSIAFSLEDAIAEVKEHAVTTTGMDIRTIRTGLWAILSMEELKKKIFKAEVTIKENEPSLIRSESENSFISGIMQKIIDKRDLVLYEKVKEELNVNEIKYLDEKLKYVPDDSNRCTTGKRRSTKN